MGTGVKTCDGLASHPGRSSNTLSCLMLQKPGKLRQCGPPRLLGDFSCFLFFVLQTAALVVLQAISFFTKNVLTFPTHVLHLILYLFCVWHQGDDISRISKPCKIVERMVNQNTFDDIAQGIFVT